MRKKLVLSGLALALIGLAGCCAFRRDEPVQTVAMPAAPACCPAPTCCP